MNIQRSLVLVKVISSHYHQNVTLHTIWKLGIVNLVLKDVATTEIWIMEFTLTNCTIIQPTNSKCANYEWSMGQCHEQNVKSLQFQICLPSSESLMTKSPVHHWSKMVKYCKSLIVTISDVDDSRIECLIKNNSRFKYQINSHKRRN